MKIKEIDNLNLNDFYLKLSKNSITVKDSFNKTKKVINDIKSVNSLQFNKKVDINIKLSKKGVRLTDLLNKCANLYVDDSNNLYHIANYAYDNKDLFELLDKAGVRVIKAKILI